MNDTSENAGTSKIGIILEDNGCDCMSSSYLWLFFYRTALWQFLFLHYLYDSVFAKTYFAAMSDNSIRRRKELI